MFPTIALRLSKRVTIPQLSPTHTSARILEFYVKQGQSVESTDALVLLECSEDFLSAENRDPNNPHVHMIVEAHDEGQVQDMIENWQGKWLKVGTQIATLNDGDLIDGDWMWQAYLHKENKR
jgi:hypothetical protein